MDEAITSAIKMLEKITQAGEVTVKFFKKTTGESRIMRCTLDFEKIPKKDKPKSVNLKAILKQVSDNKIIHVYDLDKKGWRSISFETAEWLETPTKRYSIRK